MKKYAQLENLCEIFDLSRDYFKRRMQCFGDIPDPDKPFKEGVHFFKPPSCSKTKKALLWDIEAVDRWIRSGGIAETDTELAELLRRTAI